MECPVCAAHASPAEGSRGVDGCPSCGIALRDTSSARATEVVEGTAERGPISAELPIIEEAGEETERIGAVSPTCEGIPRQRNLVATRPSLPAVLWSRPAVRTVAGASAGAVALTLGMRLARAWLARPRANRQLVSSALPLVADMLDQGIQSPGSPRSLRPLGPSGERGTEVVETFIYMQRVIRRR